MKLKNISLLLPVVLLGCSREQSIEQSSYEPPVPRPEIQFVDSPETKEKVEIKHQALALFTNRDYDGLEKMVETYRQSKGQFADGYGKISSVYGGLDLELEDSEEMWQQRQIQLQDWIRAKPESPTPRIEMARILADYAWKARGTDWAYKVKQEDWQTFAARLQGALKYLQQASKLSEHCPVYWSTLQRVALGLSANRKQYDDIFTHAIKEFPDYEGYYFHRAVYLLPRWHGRPGEWESDLGKSADAIGGEAGDKLYARVVWYMHSYGVFTNIIKQAPGISWPRVDRGFEGILKESPDSLAAMTECAHLATLKGDKAKARNYFLQTKGQVDVCLWNGKDVFDSNFRWMFPR